MAKTLIEQILSGGDSSTEQWWHFGKILRAGVGTYDFEVTGDRGNNIVCVWLAGILSHSIYGYRESIIPIEGTAVLYILPESGSKFGIILGCVPMTAAGQYITESINPSLHSITSAVGVTAFTEPTGMALSTSKKGKVLTAISDKLRDIFPGEYAISNEQGIVFYLLKSMAGLKASDRSKLETFVLDDMVRITSGIYQHNSSLGPFQIFNDHGKISALFQSTSKQQEFYGDLNTGEYKEAMQDDTYDRKKDTNAGQKLTDNREMFSRFQMFLGELGAFVHTILCSPEVDKTTETIGTAGKHTGLFQHVVDDSGKVMIKSANGITFMRCDAIPVPKKLREAWDPKGEVESPTDTNKEPFNYDITSPWSRTLLLRDYAAYFEKMTYLPFDKRPKDWSVSEAKDLGVPQDTYDKIDNRRANFKKNADAQSAISLEDDGSILLRDSWGSEIYMRGGSIIISCPGQIELRSGMNTVILAGNDFITKANHSADITATTKDVRIKGQNNVQICAVDRGLLLESLGTHKEGQKRSDSLETHPTDETKPQASLDYNDINKGEDSNFCGVVVHAPYSQAHISSEHIEFASSARIIFRAIKDKTLDIYMRCTNFTAWCYDAFTATCSKTFDSVTGSGIRMGPSQLTAVGQSVVVSSLQNTTVLQQAGRQSVAFIDTRGEESAKHASIHDLAVADTTYPLITVDSWAIEWEDKIRFTYRTPGQYGVESSNNIKNIGNFEGRAESTESDFEFKVYQSPWQYIYSGSPSMVSWVEYSIDGTSPWPGYDFYKAEDPRKCYCYLPSEVNTIKGGRSKGRKDVVSEPNKLKTAGMVDYKIIVNTPTTK